MFLCVAVLFFLSCLSPGSFSFFCVAIAIAAAAGGARASARASSCFDVFILQSSLIGILMSCRVNENKPLL